MPLQAQTTYGPSHRHRRRAHRARRLLLVTPAGSLPSFFPGHLAGSAHKHVKHGLAALIVGVVCFLGAWMLSGKE